MASQLRWTSKSVDLLSDANATRSGTATGTKTFGRASLLGWKQQDLEGGRNYRALHEGGVDLSHRDMTGSQDRRNQLCWCSSIDQIEAKCQPAVGPRAQAGASAPATDVQAPASSTATPAPGVRVSTLTGRVILVMGHTLCNKAHSKYRFIENVYCRVS